MTVSLERIESIDRLVDDQVSKTSTAFVIGAANGDEYQVALILLLKHINLLQQRDLNRERHHEFVELIKQYESSKA